MKDIEYRDYFLKGLKINEYEALLGDNRKLHELHYKKFNPDEKSGKIIKALKAVNILVITEPWCGDSLAIFPVIKKMAEINGKWNIRISRRDENPELIDAFLTKGGRAIPKILFLDEQFNFISDWGPRPLSAMKIYEEKRDDIKLGKVNKTEIIIKIRRFYAVDRGMEIMREVSELLK